MVQISRGGRQQASRKLSVSQILFTIMLCGASFYTGTRSGMRMTDLEVVKCDSPGPVIANNNEPESSNNDAKIEAIVQQRLEAGKSYTLSMGVILAWNFQSNDSSLTYTSF